MPRNQFSPQEKLKIVKEYLCGNTSYIKLGRKYSIDESCIRQWIAKYKAFGEHAFELGNNNERYTAGFKRKVVEAYLRGEAVSYTHLDVYKRQESGTDLFRCVYHWVDCHPR